MSGIDAMLISIIPSIGVGLLFWYVMRAVIRADRNERAAIAAQEAEWDAQQEAAAGSRHASSEDAPEPDSGVNGGAEGSGRETSSSQG